MNFKINSKILLTALSKVQKAVSQNRIVPATECIRLTGKKGNIHLSACNLEVSIETDTTADFKGEFDFIIPAGKLIDYVKKLADQPLNIEIDENNLVTIKHGSGSAKIQGENADNFPVITTDNGVKFSIPDLSSELYSVAYARGNNEDPRPFIYSIWIDENNIIAGDGWVIAINKLDGDFKGIKALLPTKVTDILLSTTGDAEIELGKENCTIIVNGVTIKSRLIDDKFPEWKGLIPKPEITIEVNKADLISSIDRVIGFSNQLTKLVRLSANGGNLIIEAQNNELNEQSTETIKCTDGDIGIQIKGGLILSALPKFSSEVIKIKFTDERTSIIISEYDNDDYFALIMPTV